MLSRRGFIGGGLTAMAALASGCGRALVKPPQCAHFAADDGLTVIDAHCHIFNARDLQVSGFLNEVKFPQPVLLPLRPLIAALQAIAWNFAPSIADERRWLLQLPTQSQQEPRAPGAAAPRSRSSADFEQDTAERLSAFLREAERLDPDNVNLFKAQLFGLYAKQNLATGDVRAMTFSTDNVRLLLEAERTAASGYAPLSFLATFFRFRTQNAWAMLQMYGCESTHGVDMICPALVDFDLWIGSPSVDEGRTPARVLDQTLLLGEIARATEGRVYGYAPFNPLRASCDSDYTKGLFDAVMEGRCAGFKLYPPMGFGASGNAQVALKDIPLCRKAGSAPVSVSPARLDQVLGDFFHRCEAEDIPVIAHAAPSNSAREGREELAAPKYWRGLMGGYAEVFMQGSSRLRISLGHMGGSGSVRNAEWRRQITTLMIDKPNQVFADLSYQEEVLSSDLSALKRDLDFLTGTDQVEVKAQTLYGTDWSMLAMEAKAPQYLNQFRDALNKLQVADEVQRQVMGENAERFLGLTEGQGNQVRRKRWLEGAYRAAKREVEITS